MEVKYFVIMALSYFASTHVTAIILFPFDFCRGMLNLSSLGIWKAICSLLTVGLSLRSRGVCRRTWIDEAQSKQRTCFQNTAKYTLKSFYMGVEIQEIISENKFYWYPKPEISGWGGMRIKGNCILALQSLMDLFFPSVSTSSQDSVKLRLQRQREREK